MKKLLLTLLGVMILCGLSPHIVKAQDTQSATLDDGTPVIDVAKASALTTDLDGKLVRLQFPVNVLASGTMDGATKCKYMIYARDLESNPVVMMSKVATAPSTDDGYVPGPAFKAAADNMPASSVFIPTAGVVGKAVVENGHLIIILKDESQNIDHRNYCYKGDPKKHSDTDITSAFTTSNRFTFLLKGNTHHRIDNITAADYGRMAWIRDVSYSSNTFTDKDNNEIPVKLQDDEGYIESTAYKIYTTLTTKTDHTLAICGIVELDAAGNPYLMLRDCISMVGVPTVALPTASQTDGLKQNEAKTEGNATLTKRTTNKPGVKITATQKITAQGIFSWYVKYDGTEGYNGPINSNVATIASTDGQYFKDGICRITFSGMPVKETFPKLTKIPSDRSEYTLTLIDPLLSSPAYNTFAEISVAKPENGTTVVTSTKHYQHYSLNTSGDWPLAHGMVSYIRGNYMLVRDVKRNDDSSVADTQEQEPIFTLLKHDNWSSINSSTLYHTHQTSSYNGKAYYPRKTQEGDGVAKAAGEVTYENDNLVIDLNHSYLPTGTTHFDYNSRDLYFTCEMKESDKALFAERLEEWRISSVISNASETTLDASYVGKVVEIKGVSIAKDGEAYTIGMKQPIGMSWFEGDANMAKQQAILATADTDAMFTLSGYVMNDGKGGVEIKLLSLDNTGEIIEVCEHPGHESYYGDLSLDTYDGKVITLTGARIYRNTDGIYYTPAGSENVSFEWSTNPDGETADKAAIKTTSTDLNSDQNRFATALLHDISAKVKKDGDTYTLDILSIKSLATLNADEFGPDDMNVYVDGIPAKNNHQIGNPVYYKTINDFVKLKADAPEWSQAVYTIVSENGENIDNPVWKALDTDGEMKIDHPMILYVAGCNHGHKTQSVRRLHFERSIRVATVDKLSGLIDHEDADNDPSTQKTHLLMTGSARVVATAVVDGKPVAVVTGNDGSHYLLRSDNADAELPEAGTMIRNFAAERILADGNGIGDINTAYTANLNHDFADYVFTPTTDEEIPAPTPIITNEHTTANAEKHIRLYDAKIDADASGLTVTAGAHSIRLNNTLGCDIDGNEEGDLYVVTGIMLPRQGKRIGRQALQQDIATLADTELTLDDMEFLPLGIEKRRATAKPTYTLEGNESFENGVAVTIADVELSMECDEAYSTVSYSLDGGNTWTVYDGKPVKITESKHVSIKSSVLGFDDTVVSFEIKREYFSCEATLTPNAKGGYTEVVMAPADDLAADSYKIYYTTDGTEPTAQSTIYTAPIECDKAASIRALVIENDKRPGKASDPVDISVRANDLDITAEKGEGFSTVTIAPKDAKHVDPKAEIRYTTDGTTPDASSQLYKGEFEVEAADNGMTIKAICIEPGKTAGNVASATVAVEGLRPSCDVTISYKEAEGVYTITLTAPAGKIFYALNDATEFKLYDPAKPITYVSDTDGTCRIRAYALEEGKKEGKVAEHSFAVTGIDGVGADQEAGSVRVEGNSIIVPEGAQTFDIAGRRVNPQRLPRGIYIVRLASGKAVKAVVK